MFAPLETKAPLQSSAATVSLPALLRSRIEFERVKAPLLVLEIPPPNPDALESASAMLLFMVTLKREQTASFVHAIAPPFPSDSLLTKVVLTIFAVPEATRMPPPPTAPELVWLKDSREPVTVSDGPDDVMPPPDGATFCAITLSASVSVPVFLI